MTVESNQFARIRVKGMTAAKIEFLSILYIPGNVLYRNNVAILINGHGLVTNPIEIKISLNELE